MLVNNILSALIQAVDAALGIHSSTTTTARAATQTPSIVTASTIPLTTLYTTSTSCEPHVSWNQYIP